jgi:hypothetical protein
VSRPASADSAAAAAAESADAVGAEPVADEPARPAADVPLAVWLVTALWGSLLLGASLLWPMTYGYDEPQHVDMAYVYSVAPFHFYGPGELHMTKASTEAERVMPGYPPQSRFASITPAPRGSRPSFSQLGGHTASPAVRPNQMVQHPPLYYWAEAVVLRVPGVGGLSWDVQVWLMRLLSVLFMLPVPLLCWASTRRPLGRSLAPQQVSRVAWLAAVVPLTIPNLVRDGASVNNDSLLILSSSVLIYLLCRVLTGDVSRRTAVWVAVSLAVALLTKGFALSYPPIVLLAYLVGVRESESGWQARVRTIALPLGIAAIGGVVGGLWWLRNVVEYHAVQIHGFGPDFTDIAYGTPDNHGTLTHFVPRFSKGLASRIWAGVGVPDLPSTGPVIAYGWLVLVLLGILVALSIRGAARGDRLRATVLVAFPVLTIVTTAVGSYGTYRKWSDSVHGAQGRYVYHVIVVIAVLAAVGWQRALRHRFGTPATVLVLALAVLTNAITWLLILRSWYQPKSTWSLDELRDGAHGVLTWSPVAPAVTVTLVAVFPAALSIAAIWAILARRPAREA